ncbi:hypothetical protein FY145_01585 [Agrobacterium tumefaciens]|uniref:Uncharacterized protein n=1 Tax=Agrobacterium tumefaciens TaxID=358 RepID=A0AAP9LGS5_AGRTU|nr:hypothetical protein [Agrobacterium tumefaciens]NSZ56711.1 hypothetical protein [Agrobacterium tumefaciens]QHW11975.1 hypothetical protein CG010_27885 [Agrobacterium tumefaciens]UXS47940.1 hypothetical protein FY149_11600 [Agrobacterium tumefaciens]UXS69262.1 hypothetical protein FY146_01585 [Agrobacterium tumefaciens]UXS76925.1 hypothetical protein FY145_01585 [Agrobacterium tumefaciens]
MASAVAAKRKAALRPPVLVVLFSTREGGQSRDMEIINPGYQKFDSPALGLLSANSY